MPATLVIADDDGWLSPDIKIREVSLPSRLSAAEIRDAVNAQAGIQVPILVEEGLPGAVEPWVAADVPPLVEAQVPPLVEAQVPPLVEAQVPPLVEAQVPPLVEAQVPTLLATQVPPLVQAQVPPLVQAQVPPLVVSSLAADPTPANAAATAVAQKLTEAGVMKDAYPIAGNDTIAFSIVGSGGRRSWIEIGLDGRPTPEAAAMIATAITNAVNNLSDARVQAAITAQGIMTGTAQILGDDTVLFSITGASARRSWIEIGVDGKPTTHSAGLIAKAIETPIGAQIDAKTALLPIPQPLQPTSGAVYAVTDAQGRASWIQVGADGRPTAATVAMLQAAGLAAPVISDGSLTEAKLESSFTARVPQANAVTDRIIKSNRKITVRDRLGNILPAVSDPSVIACWGDSMTEGWPYASVDPATQSWPAVLDSLYANGTTYNGGKSGQSTDEIALRQGGLVLMVSVTGGIIPASGSVTMTTDQVIGWRLDRGWSNSVTVSGVAGTLTRNSATSFTFARTTAGVDVPVAGKVPAISVPGELYKSNVSIVFAGRNDIAYASDAGGWVDRTIAGTVAMVESLAAANPRFLVCGVMTTTGERTGMATHTDCLNINKTLGKLYPDNYYDLRKYLVTQAIYDQGITPTAQDLTNMSQDTLPPSIMVLNDGTHYSAATAAQVAQRFYEQLTTRGWLL